MSKQYQDREVFVTPLLGPPNILAQCYQPPISNNKFQPGSHYIYSNNLLRFLHLTAPSLNIGPHITLDCDEDNSNDDVKNGQNDQQFFDTTATPHYFYPSLNPHQPHSSHIRDTSLHGCVINFLDSSQENLPSYHSERSQLETTTKPLKTWRNALPTDLSGSSSTASLSTTANVSTASRSHNNSNNNSITTTTATPTPNTSIQSTSILSTPHQAHTTDHLQIAPLVFTTPYGYNNAILSSILPTLLTRSGQTQSQSSTLFTADSFHTMCSKFVSTVLSPNPNYPTATSSSYLTHTPPQQHQHQLTIPPNHSPDLYQLVLYNLSSFVSYLTTTFKLKISPRAPITATPTPPHLRNAINTLYLHIHMKDICNHYTLNLRHRGKGHVLANLPTVNQPQYQYPYTLQTLFSNYSNPHTIVPVPPYNVPFVPYLSALVLYAHPRYHVMSHHYNSIVHHTLNTTCGPNFVHRNETGGVNEHTNTPIPTTMLAHLGHTAPPGATILSQSQRPIFEHYERHLAQNRKILPHTWAQIKTTMVTFPNIPKTYSIPLHHVQNTHIDLNTSWFSILWLPVAPAAELNNEFCGQFITYHGFELMGPSPLLPPTFFGSMAQPNFNPLSQLSMYSSLQKEYNMTKAQLEWNFKKGGNAGVGGGGTNLAASSSSLESSSSSKPKTTTSQISPPPAYPHLILPPIIPSSTNNKKQPNQNTIASLNQGVLNNLHPALNTFPLDPYPHPIYCPYHISTLDTDDVELALPMQQTHSCQRCMYGLLSQEEKYSRLIQLLRTNYGGLSTIPDDIELSSPLTTIGDLSDFDKVLDYIQTPFPTNKSVFPITDLKSQSNLPGSTLQPLPTTGTGTGKSSKSVQGAKNPSQRFPLFTTCMDGSNPQSQLFQHPADPSVPESLFTPQDHHLAQIDLSSPCPDVSIAWADSIINKHLGLNNLVEATNHYQNDGNFSGEEEEDDEEGGSTTTGNNTKTSLTQHPAIRNHAANDLETLLTVPSYLPTLGYVAWGVKPLIWYSNLSAPNHLANGLVNRLDPYQLQAFLPRTSQILYLSKHYSLGSASAVPAGNVPMKGGAVTPPPPNIDPAQQQLTTTIHANYAPMMSNHVISNVLGVFDLGGDTVGQEDGRAGRDSSGTTGDNTCHNITSSKTRNDPTLVKFIKLMSNQINSTVNPKLSTTIPALLGDLDPSALTCLSQSSFGSINGGKQSSSPVIAAGGNSGHTQAQTGNPPADIPILTLPRSTTMPFNYLPQSQPSQLAMNRLTTLWEEICFEGWDQTMDPITDSVTDSTTDHPEEDNQIERDHITTTSSPLPHSTTQHYNRNNNSHPFYQTSKALSIANSSRYIAPLLTPNDIRDAIDHLKPIIPINPLSPPTNPSTSDLPSHPTPVTSMSAQSDVQGKSKSGKPIQTLAQLNPDTIQTQLGQMSLQHFLDYLQSLPLSQPIFDPIRAVSVPTANQRKGAKQQAAAAAGGASATNPIPFINNTICTHPPPHWIPPLDPFHASLHWELPTHGATYPLYHQQVQNWQHHVQQQQQRDPDGMYHATAPIDINDYRGSGDVVMGIVASGNSNTILNCDNYQSDNAPPHSTKLPTTTSTISTVVDALHAHPPYKANTFSAAGHGLMDGYPTDEFNGSTFGSTPGCEPQLHQILAPSYPHYYHPPGLGTSDVIFNFDFNPYLHVVLNGYPSSPHPDLASAVKASQTPIDAVGTGTGGGGGQGGR